MDRLNQLIQDQTFGTINESDYSEFIELLLKLMYEQNETVKFYGEQLMEIKAVNALLNQKIIIQKVN